MYNMASYCTVNNSYSCYHNGEIQPGLLYDTGKRILVSWKVPIVVSFGILANGAFLFAVYRIRSMRNITNLYLVNLAVADLVFLFVAGGRGIYQYSSSPYMDDASTFGAAGCAFLTGFTYTSYFASIAIITLVSLERFYAVTQPLRHRLVHSHSRVAKFLTGSWVLALLLATLVTPGFSYPSIYCLLVPESGEYSDLPGVVMLYCEAIDTWAKYLETCVQAGTFFVALFGNFYLYIRIIQCLNKRFEHLDVETEQCNSQPRSQIHAARVRNAVARMLIANGIIFFICQLLARIVVLNTLMHHLLGISIPKNVHYVLVIIGRILLFVNASVNPVVYNVTNARYRKATREAFNCFSNPDNTKHEGPSKRISTGVTEEIQGVSNGVQSHADIDTEV